MTNTFMFFICAHSDSYPHQIYIPTQHSLPPLPSSPRRWWPLRPGRPPGPSACGHWPKGGGGGLRPRRPPQPLCRPPEYPCNGTIIPGKNIVLSIFYVFYVICYGPFAVYSFAVYSLVPLKICNSSIFVPAKLYTTPQIGPQKAQQHKNPLSRSLFKSRAPAERPGGGGRWPSRSRPRGQGKGWAGDRERGLAAFGVKEASILWQRGGGLVLAA